MILRPDAKGKINIGEFAQGVSSYHVFCGENGMLTLYPYTEIPLGDKWLFDHKA